VVVGDVSGHGAEAAAAMARLKHGLYAFASEGRTPVAALESLPPLLRTPEAGEDTTILATLLAVVFEPAAAAMVVANAGHPPWLRLRDGQAAYGSSGGRAIASGIPARVVEEHEPLRPGDVLVFYTDGLVERPGETLDEGFERLAAIARTLDPSMALQEFCDRLVGQAIDLSAGARRDDCCVLVVRVAPTGG
jgi:serine phosphatase RsbU (regulator of sigma subunit)